MFPINPGAAMSGLALLVGIGAFFGFVVGRLMSRLLPRSRGNVWIDAALGAVGFLVAGLVIGQLATHARYDGRILTFRDLILCNELLFTIVLSLVVVALGRLLPRPSKIGRRSDAA